MVVQLSSLRVSADMDPSRYVSGMQQKIAADNAGAASSARVGAAISATDTKVSLAGDSITKLSRQYVEGFRQTEQYNRAVATLGRAIDAGNVPAGRAEAILEGLYRKYGLTANAAELTASGHLRLAAAVTTVNSKLAQEAAELAAANARLASNDNALDLNTAAHLRNANAMRMGGHQRANLLFQLNDIGVSLASGMNPLLVAVQQGSQIATIYGPGEGGIGRAFSETGNLARGMVTKFGPLLLVIGSITAGLAAITWEFNKGRKEALSFGDVTVGLFMTIGDRLSGVVQPAIKALGPWFEEMWTGIQTNVSNVVNFITRAFLLSFETIKLGVQSIPIQVEAIAQAMANGFRGGIEGMVRGAITGFNRIIEEANKVIRFFGADKAVEMLGWGSGQFDTIDPESFKLPPIGTGEGNAAARLQALTDEANNNRATILTTDYAAGFMDDWKRNSITAHNRDKKDKEGDRQRKSYDQLVRSAQQYIAEQEREAAALGMTVEAAARLRHEQELLNKAANDNIALSPSQRKAISGLAAEMAAAEERTRRLSEAYSFGRDAFGSFFQDLRSELMSGTSLWQAFGNAAVNALDSIAQRALDMAANQAFDFLFNAIMAGVSGGIGGGAGSGVGKGLAGLASFDGGGYTGNGPRSGGIDGRGGFPAILHPRETVVDHTKPSNDNNGWSVVVHNYAGAKVETRPNPSKRELALFILDTVRDASRRGAVGF